MFPVELTECWAWCEDNLVLRGFKMHFSRLGESFKRLRSNSTSNCQGKTFLSILRNFHYLNRFQVPEFLHITRKKIILIVMNFFSSGIIHKGRPRIIGIFDPPFLFPCLDIRVVLSKILGPASST